MADECVKYHSRRAELIANKKGKSYSSAISWISQRAKVSFAIVRGRGGLKIQKLTQIYRSKALEPARINLLNFLETL